MSVKSARKGCSAECIEICQLEVRRETLTDKCNHVIHFFFLLLLPNLKKKRGLGIQRENVRVFHIITKLISRWLITWKTLYVSMP